MATKIQINSLDALERLIGGDTELEFEIRRNVVEDFAKKHLRSLVDTELMKATENSIKTNMRDNCLTRVSSYTSDGYKLNSEFEKIVRERISTEANYVIDNQVREKIKSLGFTDKIDSMINDISLTITNSLTEDAINKRIDIAVAKIVKEKMGIK